MNEGKIFLGNTPSNARAYLLSSFSRLKDKHLVIPCCGQFSIAFCAIQAGFSPRQIDCSDVSLFTTILGYYVTQQPIESLEVKIDGEPFRGTVPELLYAVKLHTMKAQSKHYFQRVFLTDLIERREAHLESLTKTLSRFDQLKGISYRMADMNAVIDTALAEPENLLWVNPPGFTKGYERMYNTGGVITWKEPEYTEFKPQKGHDELREKARGAPALVVWYRPKTLTPEDEEFSVFTHQRSKATWDYVMCNRPDDFKLMSVPKKLRMESRSLAVMPADYEITKDSVIQFKKIKSVDALYYRDLFVHKMGNTQALHDCMLIIDGYVAGVVGFSSVEKISVDAFDAHTEEVYGICAPSIRHPKIGRLLMMLIKCNEFGLRQLDTLQFRTKGITTTCLSIHPEMKQHRGQYKLIRRDQQKDGSYKLRYQGDRTTQSYKEVLDEWLKKILLGQGLELWRVKVEELKEQTLNARSMPNTMFQRMTETIGRDARLESLPFSALTDKGIEIVSGHHRVRAARAAGVEEIWTIVDTTGLTPSQIKAKQLAHNAIAGVDDASMIAQIFAQIENITDIRESFIDLNEIKKIGRVEMGEVSVEMEPKTVYLVFVPAYYDKWAYLAATTPPAIEEVALVDAKFETEFRSALKTVGKSYDIKATTPIVCKIIDIINGKEDTDSWAFLADIFGAKVPPEVGLLLQRVIDKMKEEGDITDKNKWQALEYLAAEYMSGKG